MDPIGPEIWEKWSLERSSVGMAGPTFSERNCLKKLKNLKISLPSTKFPSYKYLLFKQLPYKASRIIFKTATPSNHCHCNPIMTC